VTHASFERRRAPVRPADGGDARGLAGNGVQGAVQARTWLFRSATTSRVHLCPKQGRRRPGTAVATAPGGGRNRQRGKTAPELVSEAKKEGNGRVCSHRTCRGAKVSSGKLGVAGIAAGVRRAEGEVVARSRAAGARGSIPREETKQRKKAERLGSSERRTGGGGRASSRPWRRRLRTPVREDEGGRGREIWGY
jgi:hypothetical protein